MVGNQKLYMHIVIFDCMHLDLLAEVPSVSLLSSTVRLRISSRLDIYDAMGVDFPAPLINRCLSLLIASKNEDDQ